MSERRLANRYLDTIELKPSSELIPDEYVITRSSQFYVEIFYGASYQKAAETFEKVFKETCKFTVNKHLFDNNEVFFVQLGEVITRLPTGRRAQFLSGILLIILCDGDKEKPGHLKTDKGNKEIPFVQVWDPFLKLDSLNRKPKIFLFQSHYRTCRIETDGPAPKRLYDLAAPGADMMLISRTIDKGDANDTFVNWFCDHIEKSGEYADIFEIATFSTQKCRPLIVSTLTARFFTKKAEHRDCIHSILNEIDLLKKYLSDKQDTNANNDA